MKSKFVILVIIGTLLVAAIYSSSVSVVYAARTVCWNVPDGKTTFCTNTGTEKFVRCDLISGKWVCKMMSTAPSTDIPPALNDALDATIGESQNTTKVPKTGILNDGGLIQDDKNGDNNDTNVPKDQGGLNDDGITTGPE